MGIASKFFFTAALELYEVERNNIWVARITNLFVIA